MTILDSDTPDAEALRTFFSREALATIRTFTPATVTTVRNGGKAVDVLPDVTQWQTLGDEDRELVTAVASNVPVLNIGDMIAGLFLAVDIVQGTEGWLIVSDRALDKWQFGAGAEPPPNTPDLRHHDLTDAVFIPAGSRDTHDRTMLAGLLALANRTGTCYVGIDDTRALVAVPGGATMIVEGNTVSIVANVGITGNLSTSTGATGSFTTPSGNTVTVTDGIITNIF